MPHAMDMDSPPATHQAIVCTGPSSVVLEEDVALPTVEDNEVLIKVHAIGINPVDSKTLAYSSTPGAVSGCDFAGTVAGAFGPKCQRNWPIGTRVCGWIMGANPERPSNGAFAGYLAAKGDLLFRIPDDMAFSTAATVGMGASTGGLALFKHLGLSFAERAVTPSSPAVLVYGGSTASGTMAIQLLRIAGYRAIAVCSPKNFAMVKRLGAVEAFDYHHTKCGKAIRAYTRGQLHIALDCLSTTQSMAICYDAIAASGGQYLSLDPFPTRVQQMRPEIRADWILTFTVLGDVVALGGVYRREETPEDYRFGVDWHPKIDRLLAEGKLEPHPASVTKGGLEGVRTALDMVAKKRVSAAKLVCIVA